MIRAKRTQILDNALVSMHRFFSTSLSLFFSLYHYSLFVLHKYFGMFGCDSTKHLKLPLPLLHRLLSSFIRSGVFAMNDAVKHAEICFFFLSNFQEEIPFGCLHTWIFNFSPCIIINSSNNSTVMLFKWIEDYISALVFSIIMEIYLPFHSRVSLSSRSLSLLSLSFLKSSTFDKKHSRKSNEIFPIKFN